MEENKIIETKEKKQPKPHMIKYKEWLKDDKLILLNGWARRGLTDEQMAHNMDICKQTFCLWKKQYPEFLAAVKKGKEIIDIEVESALLRRALGYKTIEVKTETDEMGNIKTVETVKEVAPETVAQIYWLKNRRPKDWNERKENIFNIDNNGILNDLTKLIKDKEKILAQEIRQGSKKDGE